MVSYSRSNPMHFKQHNKKFKKNMCKLPHFSGILHVLIAQLFTQRPMFLYQFLIDIS